MALLLFDFECPECHAIEEHMVATHTEQPVCAACHVAMEKVFVASTGSRLPDDAAWIKTVTEVVAKDSKNPHAQAFLKNPTRENLKSWMKSEGIRHLEPGEHEANKRRRVEEEAKAHERRAKFMMERHMERKRIVAGGM